MQDTKIKQQILQDLISHLTKSMTSGLRPPAKPKAIAVEVKSAPVEIEKSKENEMDPADMSKLHEFYGSFKG